MNHKDKLFKDATVTLDGNNFENCTFHNVVFDYSGGDVNMVSCKMNHFSFQFGGNLSNGLYTLYQLFGTDGMLKILRGYTEPTEGEVEI